MFPINQRFCAICIALTVERADQGTREFYGALQAKVFDVLETEYELVNGVLSAQKKRNRGPSATLARELDPKKRSKTDKPWKRTADRGVYRLHGFVETSNGWILPPRELWADERARTVTEASFIGGFSHFSARVRDRIYELWATQSDSIVNYLEIAIAYFQGRGVKQLPKPPWDEPFELERGHHLIIPFLKRAESAVSDITLAAVDFYITASIGGSTFLERVKAGVNVRVMIYDFLHPDSAEVAYLIRRSPDMLCVLSSDTVEALIALSNTVAEARAAAQRQVPALPIGTLEIRLLDRDPLGRWYVIDAAKLGQTSIAYIAARALNDEHKAADAKGGVITAYDDISACAEQVAALWAEAKPFEEWLSGYRAWRASNKAKKLLGIARR